MTITWQAEDTVEPIADTTIEGIANFTNYSVTAGCGLTYSSSTMAVTVAAGSVLHNGVTVVVAGNSVTLVADATNPRWTWIGIPSSGTADIVSGTAAAIPSVPEIGDRVPLALVYVQAILAIANNATYKLDKRVMYSGVNALMTTAGDMVYASGANTPVRLAKGTARQALLMNSGATAPEWASSPQSLLTTTGDVLYASSANTPARLGIGTANQVLTVTGGIVAWGSAASGVSTSSFTSSGTWTKPGSVTASSWTLIQVYGGGGGGGGGAGNGNTNYAAGGGGGSACSQLWIQTSLLGATETVTIGGGGAGGNGGISSPTGTVGTVGGTSTFGVWCASYGGGGGGGAL